MKTLLILLILTQISTTDEVGTLDKTKVSRYQFFWDEPMVTNGCWKIGEDKSITSAFHISKLDCLALSASKEWIEFFEFSYSSVMTIGKATVEYVKK